ncbi:hypothetical protein OLV32_08165 [Campylobacter jejuni]|nr:hypothetical protein [Campylobacter jejuni]
MSKNVKNLDTSFFGHPKPLLSLSLTELWERFSFYGIRPLLYLFMIASFEKKWNELKTMKKQVQLWEFLQVVYILLLCQVDGLRTIT